MSGTIQSEDAQATTTTFASIMRTCFVLTIAVTILSVVAAGVTHEALVASPFELLRGAHEAIPSSGHLLTPTEALKSFPFAEVTAPAALSVVHAIPLCFLLVSALFGFVGLIKNARRISVIRLANHIAIGVAIGLIAPLALLAFVPPTYSPLDRAPSDLVLGGALCAAAMLVGTFLFRRGSSSLGAWALGALCTETIASFALSSRASDKNLIDWVYVGMAAVLVAAILVMLRPLQRSVEERR